MSLRDTFEQNKERRYIMFGGKGGLGKTTFSAATAFWLAQQGHKVLVFSVDPQASLSDIFQKDIFGKGPVKIMDNLWAQEIDADSHIRAYQDQIRKKILDMYGLEAVPEEVRTVHPGSLGRAGHGRIRHLRRRGRYRRRRRVRLLHLRFGSAGARALLPLDGQGL